MKQAKHVKGFNSCQVACIFQNTIAYSLHSPLACTLILAEKHGLQAPGSSIK